MNTTLKIVSLLLSYPTQQLQVEAPELKKAILAACGTTQKQARQLCELIDDIALAEIFDVQERYVLLFDRTRSLSLHLFEHVHGESRDRGQAMVDLMAMYAEQGLVIDQKELPDYLPLFLEFLSTRPPSEAQELLGQTKHIIVTLKEKLIKRQSVYANAFVVLEAMASGTVNQSLVEDILGVPEDDPGDLEALDRIWEEEVVSFGGGAGENACGPDRLRTQMRAAARRQTDGNNSASAEI